MIRERVKDGSQLSNLCLGRWWYKEYGNKSKPGRGDAVLIESGMSMSLLIDNWIYRSETHAKIQAGYMVLGL